MYFTMQAYLQSLLEICFLLLSVFLWGLADAEALYVQLRITSLITATHLYLLET